VSTVEISSRVMFLLERRGASFAFGSGSFGLGLVDPVVLQNPSR
jgi:hypothetical protein